MGWCCSEAPPAAAPHSQRVGWSCEAVLTLSYNLLVFKKKVVVTKIGIKWIEKKLKSFTILYNHKKTRQNYTVKGPNGAD